MCGRLACSLCPEEICKAIAYNIPDKQKSIRPSLMDERNVGYIPSYNLSPSQTVLVLTDGAHLEDCWNSKPPNYLIAPMRWGLNPEWTIKKSNYTTPHNSRLETMMSVPLYNIEMKNNHRGVLLCEGYYEWQKFDKGKSQPFYFFNQYTDPSAPSDRIRKPLMKLAVIFNTNTNSQGEIKATCSVITKESISKEIRDIHHRMPVILNSYDDVQRWIDSKIPYNVSYEFLKDFANEEAGSGSSNIVLQYHPVDRKYVDTSTCNTEQCIQRINMKRQLRLDQWLTSGGPKITKK